MSRIVDLTHRLLEGDLDDAARAELDAVLEADPSARAVHVGLLELEGHLRGDVERADVAPAVQQRLQQEREARVLAGVMSHVEEKSGLHEVRGLRGRTHES